MFLCNHPPETRERELNYSLVGGGEPCRCIEILKNMRVGRRGVSYNYSRVGFHADFYYNNPHWLSLIRKYPERGLAWRICDRLRRRRNLPVLAPVNLSSAKEDPESLGHLFCTHLMSAMRDRGYDFGFIHTQAKKCQGMTAYQRQEARNRHYFIVTAYAPEIARFIFEKERNLNEWRRFNWIARQPVESGGPGPYLDFKEGHIPVARIITQRSTHYDRTNRRSELADAYGSIYYTDWCTGNKISPDREFPMQRFADMMERAYVFLSLVAPKKKDLFGKPKMSRFRRKRLLKLGLIKPNPKRKKKKPELQLA